MTSTTSSSLKFAGASLWFSLGVTASYAILHQFKTGYFRYFEIPSELISVTGFDLLTLIFPAVLLLSGVYFIGRPLWWLWKQGAIYQSIIRTVLILGPMVILEYLSGRSYKSMMIILGMFAPLCIFFDFLWPGIFKYKGTYVEKLQQHRDAEIIVEGNRAPGVSAAFIKIIGVEVMLQIILLFFVATGLLPFSRTLGAYTAREQVQFQRAILPDVACAVVQLDSVKYVCAEYVPETRALKRKFRVGQVVGQTFALEKTGSLMRWWESD